MREEYDFSAGVKNPYFELALDKAVEYAHSNSERMTRAEVFVKLRSQLMDRDNAI